MALILSVSLPALAELHPNAKKDKFGYVDDSGAVIIKHSYQVAMPFENGMAKVKKGDKWGYIDETGSPVIAIQYDDIQPFNNGIARVKKGKKLGYIRQDGSIYIKPDFDFIGGINEQGYVWVAKGKTLDAALKGLYKDGVEIIKPKYTALGFYLLTDSCDYRDGKPLFPNMPNEMTANLSKLSTSDVPYIWATLYGTTNSIFDLNGNQLCKVSGYKLGAPKDGFSLAIKPGKKDSAYNYFVLGQNNKKWFSKDIKVKNETLATPPCHPFVNGYAACNTGSGFQLYSTDGKSSSAVYTNMLPVGNSGYIVTKDGKYGLVSGSGKEVTAPIYNLILAPANPKEELVLAARDQNDKCGYINIDGTVIVPFQYDNVLSFRKGFGYVKSGNFWGIVDRDNKQLIAPKWESIIMCRNENDAYTWVQNPTDKKWYAHSLADDKHSCNTGYKSVNSFDSKERACVMFDDDKIGAVTPQGKIILPAKFSTLELAVRALDYMDEKGQTTMSETDAYRFNIYVHPNRHTYKLQDKIDKSMWDY